MIDFANILNEPLVKSILTSLCSNYLLTSAKELLTSFKQKPQEYNEVLDAIDNTINYAKSYLNIDISYTNFIELFNDSSYQEEIKYFTDGVKPISLDKIAIIFSEKINQEQLTHVEILDIIKTFFDYLIEKLLENKESANKVLFSQNQIILTKQSDLFDETKLIIKKLENSFANKLDIIVSNTEFTNNKLAIIENKIDSLIQTKQPEDIDIDIQRINILFENGLIIKSREEYLNLLSSTNKTNIDKLWKLNHNLGMTYVNTFEEENAILYFETAFNLKPLDIRSKLLKLHSLLIKSPTEAIIYGNSLLSEESHKKEILQILTHANIKVGTSKNCLQYYENIDLDDASSNYDYSLVLMDLQNFQKAEEHLFKSIELDKRPEYYDALSNCILLKVHYQTFGTIDTPEISNYLDKLKSAKNYSDIACSKLEQQQNSKLLSIALFNRGTINYLLKDYINSVTDYARAEQFGFSGESLFINQALSYLKLHNLDMAIFYCKKAYVISREHFKIYAGCLYDSNRLDEAEAILLENLQYPVLEIDESNYRYYLMLAEILSKKVKHEEASIIISAIELVLPDNYEIAIYKVQYLWYQNKFQEVILLLKDALSKNPSKEQQLEIYLANYLYQLPIPEWNEAYKLYEKVIKRDNSNYWVNNDIAIERAAVCLFNLQKYSELFKLISENKPETNRTKLFLENIKGNTYFLLGNIKDANIIYKKLAPLANQPGIYIAWAMTEFRLGNIIEAEKILDQHYNAVKDDLYLAYQIIRAYHEISRIEKAFEYIWEIYYQRPNDIRVLQLLFFISIQFTNKHTELDAVSPEKLEIIKNLPDEIERKQGEEKFLTKITVNENFDELRIFLQDLEEKNKNLEELLKKDRIPISIFAKFSSKQIKDIWYWSINNKDIFLNSYRINHNDLAKSLTNFDENKNLIIDSSAIYLFIELGLFEIIFNHFTVNVPQVFIDELANEIQSVKNNYINTKQNKSTLFSHNGQLSLQEISYEDLIQSVTLLQSLFNKIKNKGIGISIDIEPDEINKLSSNFSLSSIQSFLHSHATKTIILSDELLIRDFFQVFYKVESTSSYSLIYYLKLRNIIEQPMFHKALYKMVAFGYEYIPFSCETLYYSLKDFNFEPNNFYFQSLIKKLNNPITSPYSAWKVKNDFWNLLKRKNISENKLKEIESIFQSTIQ